MKKQQLILSIAMVVAILVSNVKVTFAEKWRVNLLSNYNGTSLFGDNYGGSVSNPVFKNIDQAQNAIAYVNSGNRKNDTLYLEGCPSNLNYPTVYLIKPLVIIGTGYFLNLNPNTSNDQLESKINNFRFNTGSAGSKIIGVNFIQGMVINVDSIDVKRCYFSPLGTSPSIDFSSNNLVHNINILQNFFDNTPNVPNSVFTINGNGGVTDIRINFNIFKRPLLVTAGTTTYTVLECINNTFDCPIIPSLPSIKMNCLAFHNNIVKTAIALDIGTTLANITNNSGSLSSQFDLSTIYNNKVVAMNALFVTPGTSTDGNYLLVSSGGGAPNWPGLNGGDRGAFGGIYPTIRYALSGNAPIPVIYGIINYGNVTPSSGLPVTIQAKTIK